MLNLFKGFFSTKKEKQAEEAASYFEQKMFWYEMQSAAQKALKLSVTWNLAIADETLKNVLKGMTEADARDSAVWSLSGSKFEKDEEEAWQLYNELRKAYEGRYC